MICAKCKSEMGEFVLSWEEINQCEKCFSVFFDEDEMYLIKDLNEDEIRMFKEARDNPDFEHIKKVYKSNSDVLCPKCESKMLEYNYAYDSPILINRCPKCSGVFLDPGEVVEIRDFLNGKYSDQNKIAAAKLKLVLNSKKKYDEEEPKKKVEPLEAIVKKYF